MFLVIRLVIKKEAINGENNTRMTKKRYINGEKDSNEVIKCSILLFM